MKTKFKIIPELFVHQKDLESEIEKRLRYAKNRDTAKRGAISERTFVKTWGKHITEHPSNIKSRDGIIRLGSDYITEVKSMIPGNQGVSLKDHWRWIEKPPSVYQIYFINEEENTCEFTHWQSYRKIISIFENTFETNFTMGKSGFDNKSRWNVIPIKYFERV
jgi:hypothetical protein